jgi:SAM-dependent methyltransferase
VVFKDGLATAQKFVDVVENKSGVIAVTTDAVVYGGGAYDGIISVDLVNDRNALIRPLSLPLYHPRPREVLMVGLATGAWAQIVAANPQVEHLTIVEINPGYLELIGKYEPVRTLLANPKVEIIVDDGRRWVGRHPDRQFDAIVQNTTWHFRPNTTNLLSQEYLRLLARHLRPGGVLMFNTTGSSRAMLTGCTVFPFALREFNMIIASNAPLALDPARLKLSLNDLRIDGRRPLDNGDGDAPARIETITAQLASFRDDETQPMETCASIMARARGLPVITDDNMGEEW